MKPTQRQAETGAPNNDNDYLNTCKEVSGGWVDHIPAVVSSSWASWLGEQPTPHAPSSLKDLVITGAGYRLHSLLG